MLVDATPFVPSSRSRHGYGLDELYSEQPETGVERKIRTISGLVRYDAKNDHRKHRQHGNGGELGP